MAKIKIEWVPSVVVPRVSDRGDKVFDAIHQPGDHLRPLEAEWLAKSSESDLVGGLERVVAAYREWISFEEARIPNLPVEFQAQAQRHIDRCELGAQRMAGGITSIGSDKDMVAAFQLAQLAMATQFGWSRQNEVLKWRPFQLAFQLLVIPSLAQRSHSDREIMDLLWFPHGRRKDRGLPRTSGVHHFAEKTACHQAGRRRGCCRGHAVHASPPHGATVPAGRRYDIRVRTPPQEGHPGRGDAPRPR